MASNLQRFSYGRSVLPHVTVERRHLRQKMLRVSDC